MINILKDIVESIRQFEHFNNHYPKYLYMSLKTLDKAGYEEVITLCSFNVYNIELKLDESIEDDNVYVTDELRNKI